MQHIKRANNKGATLVTTMIILAVVGILATVALWISLNNFQMKVTNQNIADNFYSAESVLEQIRAGLQSDVSDSLEVAYAKVMQNYGASDNITRNSVFASTYIQNLRNRLRFGATPGDLADPNAEGLEFLCSKLKLERYIAADMQPYTKIYSADKPEEGYFLMDATTYAVIIKNIVVEYTDDKGYFSVIQTDIVMVVPDLNLTSAQSAPKVFTYSMIGNAGITFKNTIGINVNGNVYAGSKSALKENKGTTADNVYYESMVVDKATVSFDNTDYLVVDGDLNISGNSSANSLQFASDPSGQLWARNINLTSSDIGLFGATYVSDDMTLLGTNPSVVFAQGTGNARTKGNYIGYGDSTEDASKSSAILINGTGSTLDLSGIESMVIAGHAYIGTSKVSSAKNGLVYDNNDVVLGESIAVKGDQIAYLVPAECIATVNGISTLKQNPITIADYDEIMKTPAAFKIVDPDVRISRLGKSLSDYLDGESIEKHYKKVVVPSKTGDEKDGLVYFYLDLNPDRASDYFIDYYKADSKKLEKYTAFYTNAIRAHGEDTLVYTAGLYAEYDDMGLKYNYASGADAINGHIGNLPVINEALTTRLISDYTAITNEQKNKSVYKNIIQEVTSPDGNRVGLTNFLAPLPNKRWDSADINLANGKLGHVVLIDGNYTASDDSKIYLILATGDVTITKSFTGTIVTKGKIIVEGEANITITNTTTANIKKLLSSSCSNVANGGSDELHVYDFFKDGSIFVTFGFGTGDDEDINADSIVSLSDTITYENWKKR